MLGHSLTPHWRPRGISPAKEYSAEFNGGRFMCWLFVEHVRARHRDDAHRDALARQRAHRLNREIDFGTGRNDDRIELRAAGIGEHIAAARDRGHLRVRAVLMR